MSSFDTRKGTYLPYNVKLPSGLSGGLVSREVVIPEGSKGEYRKEPFYLFNSEFRPYGQLNRGNWDF